MNHDAYLVKQSKKELRFEFESVSSSKRIKKIIAYELIGQQEQLYNLSLVDVTEDGQVSDLAVSDNADLEKVLTTVIQTIPLFFRKFPEAKLFFQGSTLARTRLYQITIAKVLDQATERYRLYGFQHGVAKPFVRNQSYEAFLVTFKSDRNETNEST